MDPERIEQLRDPAVFPESAERVEIIQTHLSVVCLVGEFAYKLKKAIRLPFVDFTSLENRKKYCEEELRLNRRLCPGVYLSVEELREDTWGGITLRGGEGAIIDFAVKMRRLPPDRMMDVLLAADSVKKEEIEELAQVIARFHKQAERSPEIDWYANPERLARFAVENFEESEKFLGEILSRDLHAALWRKTKQDFTRWIPTLKRRLAEGRAVDGHGDLHARNICLTDPIAVYDCIEFQPAFRCADVALEHAFLLMDLRFRGHQELASIYLDRIEAETGDREMRTILPTLMQYRAVVRSKVSAITASEPEIAAPDREKSANQARRYMRLAAGIAVEERVPLWIAMCGLPGSGKSTVAAVLQETMGWQIFSSDRIRKELAGYSASQKLPAEFYSPGFSEKTYRELESRAKNSPGAICLLDANYRTRRTRTFMRSAAEEAGAALVLIHLAPGKAILQDRLQIRGRQANVISDADGDILEKLASEFEEPREKECDLLIEIIGEGSPEKHADKILARVLESCE